MSLPSSCVNPFLYPTQTMFKHPNTDESNPSPIPDPNTKPSPPSFFFPFANSLLTQNNGSLETHFVSQSLEKFDTLAATKEKPMRVQRKRKVDDEEKPNPNPITTPTPRKRIGKSDRHSKIYTAQGPRDRRMRLSVHIARKFFDLQDMLGFDKASKTIEWLFCQSRSAIREVALNQELQMGIDHSSISNFVNGMETSFELGEKNGCELENVVQVSQVKESRDEARARAKERTRDKSIGVDTFEVNPIDFEALGLLGYFDQEIHFPVQEADIIENIVGASSFASNSILDFDNDLTMSGGADSCNFMGMFGNLELMVPLAGNYLQEQNPNFNSYDQI